MKPNRAKSVVLASVLLMVAALCPTAGHGQESPNRFLLHGRCVGPDGTGIPSAQARAEGTTVTADEDGRFHLALQPGDHRIEITAAGFTSLHVTVPVSADSEVSFELQPTAQVVVHAESETLSPDPSARSISRDEAVAANPGRPGVPVSIPGYPAETASGGIKAPQYFAPGVASDHGVLIAQFVKVGDFLFPNNLSANAHGNGYADPNPLIPQTIGDVASDGAAFDVRYGDHAVNLSTTYGLRSQLEPSVEAIFDSRNVDLVSSWSPQNPRIRAWIASEAAFGNGYLDFVEHRRQGKINAMRQITAGRHELTLFGVGYYGFSRIPGLVPIDRNIPGDTIDPRQSDQTHSSLFVLSDTWTASSRSQVRLSGFFRTYNLTLLSNFGDGLIRQSEFRTVAGGNATYVFSSRHGFSVLAGTDLHRDSIPQFALDRAGALGKFESAGSNALTISSFSPFVSVGGSLSRWIHYSLGIRRDDFFIDNQDFKKPFDSFRASPGTTSPKATLSFYPGANPFLSVVAFSVGDAFHTNDPRIGAGTQRGTPIAKSRAFQLVATKVAGATEFRITLATVSNSTQLAQIDPDTGLQMDLGSSLIRSVTVAASRRFSSGYLQVSFARANATDLWTRNPMPEAPRLIWDATGTWQRLPLHLRAQGEFEYVGRKPLGDGFAGVPVREIRLSLLRSFAEGKWDAGINTFLGNGYTGQTLETLQLAGEPSPFERIVGVRLKSYVAVSLSYHFAHERSK